MKKEVVAPGPILDIVKFSLSPRERLRRLGNLIPDLMSPRFWDGENYIYDSSSERWSTFIDDLKTGIIGYFYGAQVSQSLGESTP